MEQTIKHEGVEIVVRTKTAFEDDFTSQIWFDWWAMLEVHYGDKPVSNYMVTFAKRLLILVMSSDIKVTGFLPDIDIYNPNYNMLVKWHDIISKKRDLYNMWSKAYEVVNKEEDSPLSENSADNGETTTNEALEIELSS